MLVDSPNWCDLLGDDYMEVQKCQSPQFIFFSLQSAAFIIFLWVLVISLKKEIR